MPAEQLAGLLDALRHRHQVAAAADRATLERLAVAIAEARQVARSVALTARRELLRELLAVAIDEAGDTVGRRCSALLRGGGSPATVRVALDELMGLIDLLDTLDGAD